MLLVDDRADVRLVDDHVDDGEFGVREIGGDLLERRRPREAGHDDRVVAVLGELAQRLLALGVVLDFEIAVFDAGFGLELLGAVEGGFVEGFVELAAEIIDDRRLDVRGEGRNGHRCSGQKAQYETLHVIHTLSVVFPLNAAPTAVPIGRSTAYGRSGFLPLRPHSCTAQSKFHEEF